MAEKRAAAEEKKREKLALAAEKKDAKNASISFEEPATNLLKSLDWIDAGSEQVSAAELTAFARANRAQLGALGVELTSLARKDLMPALLQKMQGLTPAINWSRAPPKALAAPRAEAAPAAAPAAAEPLALTCTMAESTAPAPAEPAATSRAKRPCVGAK